MTTYNTENKMLQGGSTWEINGTISIESGGIFDVESGGYFKIAGTAVTATAAELNKLASSSSVSAQASKVVIADANKKINFGLIGTGAAVSASGLLAGVGTSANPVTTETAGANWLEIRSQTTATSGDNRLAYFRHNIAGAGASGECIRAFTDLTAAADTCNGAHFSIQAGATGYVTGQASGVRSQLYLKDEVVHANGTYYGGISEIWSTGTASSLAAVTKHAIHSFAATGNATGAATVLNALSFDGATEAGVTKMITTNSLTFATAPCAIGIAVLVNGTRGYIPVVTGAEWD